ncbi:MAG: hypothetical protein ACKODX_16290 [Gemmata sp.]
MRLHPFRCAGLRGQSMTRAVSGLTGLLLVGAMVAGRAAGDGPVTPAKPPASTGASTEPDRRKYTSYDYTEAGKALRLTVPDGLPVVRGVLVVGPWSGGDSRDLHREVWYREFLHLHGFAFLGAEGLNARGENFKLMQNALKQFAADAKRPELVHAPYVATGFSAGGGFANRLLLEAPDKVIAAVLVGSRPNLTGASLTAAHLGAPVLIINGEHEDNGMAAAVEPVLKEFRPKGAPWGWVAAPGLGHERDGQEVLAVPMLAAAVRLRYPTDGDVRKGPVGLKPVDPTTGWLADNTTWQGPLATVAPHARFKGDTAKSSYLPNEDLAFIYRAYATRSRPLMIRSPRNTADSARELVWDAGGSVTVRVDDARFAGWTKLELFDGAVQVGERTRGPAEFTVRDLKPGYHALSVLGTDAAGAVRTSDPVLVVVRK